MTSWFILENSSHGPIGPFLALLLDDPDRLSTDFIVGLLREKE